MGVCVADKLTTRCDDRPAMATFCPQSRVLDKVPEGRSMVRAIANFRDTRKKIPENTLWDKSNAAVCATARSVQPFRQNTDSRADFIRDPTSSTDCFRRLYSKRTCWRDILVHPAHWRDS